mmetsp:Transcript_25335/g.39285  ORF Transcript_25335/g.39285 Transcript_25335/m.39285 type:complete len:137 (+) Transcript_25335:109-519(+)
MDEDGFPIIPCLASNNESNDGFPESSSSTKRHQPGINPDKPPCYRSTAQNSVEGQPPPVVHSTKKDDDNSFSSFQAHHHYEDVHNNNDDDDVSDSSSSITLSWACEACTFVNFYALRECEVCATQRPAKYNNDELF